MLKTEKESTACFGSGCLPDPVRRDAQALGQPDSVPAVYAGTYAEMHQRCIVVLASKSAGYLAALHCILETRTKMTDLPLVPELTIF